MTSRIFLTLSTLLLVVLALGACGDRTCEPTTTTDTDAPDASAGAGMGGMGGMGMGVGVPGVAGIPVLPEGTVVGTADFVIDETTGFATNAFPPPMPKAAWHESTWTPDACLECHATGEDDAPKLVHKGLPELAKVGACRTCHVMSPDKAPKPER